jgi:hypothetical protein
MRSLNGAKSALLMICTCHRSGVAKRAPMISGCSPRLVRTGCGLAYGPTDRGISLFRNNMSKIVTVAFTHAKQL